MSAWTTRPQELVGAVVRDASPILEMWLVGGRGTQQQPLEVQVLGELGAGGRSDELEPLIRLMRRHGPWLTLDLTGVDEVHAGGLSVLHEVMDEAARRGGIVTTQWGGALGGQDAGLDRVPPPVTSSGGDARPGGRALVGGAAIEGGALVLGLVGELDADNSRQLDQEIHGHLERWEGPVVLDLSQLTFLDSTALSCLVRLRKELEASGSGVTIRHPTPPVRRAFAVTGLLDAFLQPS